MITTDNMHIFIGDIVLDLVTDIKFSLDEDYPSVEITRLLPYIENLNVISEGLSIRIEIKTEDKMTTNVMYENCQMYDHYAMVSVDDKALKEVLCYTAESVEVKTV